VSANLYLVGMPGSGKTEVGRVLAARLQMPFADMDAEVEAEAGRTGAQLFAEEGESGFREREKALLSRLSARTQAIVACGGGTVIDPDNRALLRASGRVVWLAVPVDVVMERVEMGADRPLLRKPEDVSRLLAEREPLYREVADLIVDGQGDVETVVDRVQEAIA
jgi:shikimate kinase